MTAVVGATPSAVLLSAKPVPTRTYLEGASGVVVFSPDGRTLASTSWDNTVKLWDVARAKELYTLTGHNNGVKHACFSPDGLALA